MLVVFVKVLNHQKQLLAHIFVDVVIRDLERRFQTPVVMYHTKFTQKDHYGISFINKVAGPHTSSMFNKTLKSDCCIKKRVGFICFNESSLKMMENAFSSKK